MEQIYDKIREIAGKYHISKIVLYGSRARGDNRPKSDIDIAVYFLNGYREKESAKFRSEIMDDFPALYEFDVVAIDENTNEKLLKNIEEDGVTIYMREKKLDQYQRAVARLDEAVRVYSQEPTELIRDGLIQRFEFTTELSWKSVKEYLEAQNLTDFVLLPKPIMRKAFSINIIDDEMWLKLLDDRNLTSHIYKEEIAIEISDRIVNSYLKLFVDLQEKLENLMD